jgi:hypothetical protein
VEPNGERYDQQERATYDSAGGATPHDNGKTGVTKSETDKTQTSEIRDLQRRGERRERITVAVAVIAALIAAAAWWTSERQLSIMQRQTDVMQDQLSDARKAAIESDKLTQRQFAIATSQAESMKTLANANKVSAENSRILADANKGIADSATKSASATERLASATSEAAQASRSLAESATHSNVAAQRLADAAHEANIVTRDLVTAAQQTDETNRNVQRAFVFVRSFAVVQIVDNWWLHIEFENAGNTPTRDLAINSFCAAVPRDYFSRTEPDVFKVDTSNKTLWAHPRTAALLGPRQTAFIRSCLIPGGLNLARYRIQSTPWYVWGTVDYKDILHGNAHRAEFCFTIDIAKMPEEDWMRVVGKKQPVVESVPCQQHNCADEECERTDEKASPR